VTSHHVAPEDLSAYVDGELGHDERLAVESHLASCRACRDELAALSWTVEFVRGMPRSQVPPGVSFHVPVGEPSALDEASGRSGLSILAWGSMAVAAAAVVLAVLQARPFAMTGLPARPAELAMEDASRAVAVTEALPAGAPLPEGAAGSAITADRDQEQTRMALAPTALDEIGGAGDLAAEQAVTSSQTLTRLDAEAVATASATARATQRPAANIARAPSGPRAGSLAPQPEPSQSVRWIALAAGAVVLAAAAFALGRRSRS
jgi:anti-sigma factor RsiW